MKSKVKNANMGLSDQEHIRMPSQATVYRWVKDLNQHLVARARLGRGSAGSAMPKSHDFTQSSDYAFDCRDQR